MRGSRNAALFMDGRRNRDNPAESGLDCELVGSLQGWRDVEEQVAQLKRTTVGWANYFCQVPVSQPYRIPPRLSHQLWLVLGYAVKPPILE